MNRGPTGPTLDLNVLRFRVLSRVDDERFATLRAAIERMQELKRRGIASTCTYHDRNDTIHSDQLAD